MTCTVFVRAEVEFMLLAEVIVQLYAPFSTPSTATLVMLAGIRECDGDIVATIKPKESH